MQISSSTISNSTNAEMELRSLANDYYCRQRGRQYNQVTAANNKVPILDFAALQTSYHSSDIFPLVKVELVRPQDRTNKKRKELAKRICNFMQYCLLEKFTGDSQKSELVLRVNVDVVSDGSKRSPQADRFSSMFGRGKAQGHGQAKLVVSYCLFSRVSGAVAVVKQLCRLEDSQEVLDLVPDLNQKIIREVTFLSSCHSSPNSSKTCPKPAATSFLPSCFSSNKPAKDAEESSSCSTTSNDDDDDDDSFAL